MTRTVAREIAILLSFSVQTGSGSSEEQMDRFFDKEHYVTMVEENSIFSEYPDQNAMNYIRTVVCLISEHFNELDSYIEKYANGWKVKRISRTAVAIMRCAICEILWLSDVPNAAAINEAIELAKKYENEEVVSFINGILGGFIRGEIQQ